MPIRQLHALLLGVHYGDIATLSRARLLAIIVEVLSLDITEAAHVDIEDMRKLVRALRARKRELKGGDDAPIATTPRRDVVKAAERETAVLAPELYKAILEKLPFFDLLAQRKVNRMMRAIVDRMVLPNIPELPAHILQIVPRAVLALLTGLRTLRGMPPAMDSAILRTMTKLVHLEVLGGSLVTNMDLAHLTNLEWLRVHSPTAITAAGLQPLVKLSSLRMTLDGQPSTDQVLRGLPSLTTLDISESSRLRGSTLEALTTLRGVGVYRNTGITPMNLAQLPLLDVLFINPGAEFTDDGLARLSSVTALIVDGRTWFSGNRLGALTKLKRLEIISARFRTPDAQFARLTNLTGLRLRNAMIGPTGLAPLTALTELHLGGSSTMTDAGIYPLRHTLTILRLGSATRITDDVLALCVNLRHLVLGHNTRISDITMLALTQLTSLGLGANTRVSNVGIAALHQLRALALGKNQRITDRGIASLLNLRYLQVGENRQITSEAFDKLPRVSIMGK